MDLNLSDEQAAVVQAVGAFLTKETPFSVIRAFHEMPRATPDRFWRQAAELGFVSMLVPERLGGVSLSGAPVADLALVAELVGRTSAPGPLVPCNIVASALAASPTAARHDQLVRDLVDGTAIAAWAMAEPSSGWSHLSGATRLTSHGDGFRLNGEKCWVEAADTATHMLVTATAEQRPVQVLVAADAPGVGIAPVDSLDLTRRFGSVRLTDVAVEADALISAPDRGANDIGRQERVAIALHCAESVGAAARAFELALEYATARVAFGRPIGSYQALKHRLADDKLRIEAASGLATSLAEVAEREDADTAALASAAKSYIGDELLTVVQDCVQVFGGIGLTWEHDLHILLRRVATNFALYGAPNEHRDRLCAAAGF